LLEFIGVAPHPSNYLYHDIHILAVIETAIKTLADAAESVLTALHLRG
jgi:hypothetical protein